MIAREPKADASQLGGSGGQGAQGGPGDGLGAGVAVIATGLFVTGLGWPGLIGRLPFGLLLKNQLQLAPQEVAAFWAVAAMAWYLKPLIGLVCDAYPLFGTRRHAYLILGAALSGLLWLAFALSPQTYRPLLVLMTALYLTMAFVSAAVGGLLVALGQRHGATGRLSALRLGLVGGMSLVAGPLGGWLATRPIGWTAGLGAVILFSLVPVAALLHREPRGARADAAAVFAAASRQLRAIVRSRPMWTTGGLLFLVYLAPGFQTPLLYYQQDVLRFDPPFMGTLQLLGGLGALAGAAAYGVTCRHLPLRTSLVAGIALNAGSTLFYLGYGSANAAAVITVAAALLGTLALLPLYDLAARATPPGSESFGYALLMSVQSVAVYGVSDLMGAYLYGRLHLGWTTLVWLNAGSTALVLLFVPLLPRALLSARETADAAGLADGRARAPAASRQE
jgi:predicted MFS family arabinose efflux permease